MTENKDGGLDKLPCHPASDIRHLKRDLRRAIKERRAEAHAKNPDAPLSLRDRFLEAVDQKVIAMPGGGIVAGYIAQDDEMDARPLMDALQARGYAPCLPTVADASEPLSFRAWKPGDALTPGFRNIPVPARSAAALEPDIVLTPLLAFDAHGNRLGRGGGHYDRTLISLRKRRKILAIGIGFDCQKIPAVPAGPNDARLDKIVTEIGFFTILTMS